MSIPNPYPNIADKEINDAKTWSSAKIIDELQPALDTVITCEETYEGNIVTFNNLTNKEITSLECKILPIQEGTGTPSPSNPRPISGTSVLDIYHSGADTSDYDTTSVPLGQTVYGGSAEIVGGTGSKNKSARVLDGTEGWFLSYSGEYTTVFSLGSAMLVVDQNEQICSHFNFNSQANTVSQNRANTFVQGTSGNLFIQVSNDLATTAEGFKSWLASEYANGTPVTYVAKTTPTDFTFTGQSIESLEGVNNIWSDAGDIKVTTDETETIGNILKERGILP